MNRLYKRGSPVIFIALIVLMGSLVGAYRHYHNSTTHSKAWHACYEMGALRNDTMKQCMDFEMEHSS
jgi:hypothetical protein